MTLPGRPRVQAVSTHRRFELHDGCQLCSTEPGVATNPRWLASTGAVGKPAVVPGTVAEAMRCAGGLDLEHAPNFDERDWWYRCRMEVEA